MYVFNPLFLPSISIYFGYLIIPTLQLYQILWAFILVSYHLTFRLLQSRLWPLARTLGSSRSSLSPYRENSRFPERWHVLLENTCFCQNFPEVCEMNNSAGTLYSRSLFFFFFFYSFLKSVVPVYRINKSQVFKGFEFISLDPYIRSRNCHCHRDIDHPAEFPRAPLSFLPLTSPQLYPGNHWSTFCCYRLICIC